MAIRVICLKAPKGIRGVLRMVLNSRKKPRPV